MWVYLCRERVIKNIISYIVSFAVKLGTTAKNAFQIPKYLEPVIRANLFESLEKSTCPA